MEIRRVNRIEQRLNEASKLGFTKIFCTKNSLSGLTIPQGIQVIGVTTVSEVLKRYLIDFKFLAMTKSFKNGMIQL